MIEEDSGIRTPAHYATATNSASEPSVYYFAECAAAFVRGTLAGWEQLEPQDLQLFEMDLTALAVGDLERLIRIGHAAGLRLHRFKRTMGLRRVARVLGILRGLAPADLLDIGSGRGAFLWPLLDVFPTLPVTMIDQDPRRVADACAVQQGGLQQLTALSMDATDLRFPERHFDVVTMLEVLEHIPDPERALREVLRVARRSVVLSVPSRPDDNPEHIHLFSQVQLQQLLKAAGARTVRFEYELNHLIAVARVE